MRKDDFMFECMNYISDETIQLSEMRRKVRKQKRKKQSPPEVAAIAVVAIIFAIGSSLPIGISTGLFADKESDIRYEDLEEKIVSHNEIMLDGHLYNLKESYVDKQYISKKLTTISNTELKLSFDVYEIESISSECAVAVKREDDLRYYVFNNTEYKPETLGQLMDDLSLEENLVFEEIYLRNGDEEVLCEGYDEEEVFELLFEENANAKITSKKIQIKLLGISSNIKKIENIDISIEISVDGYVYINILDYELVFLLDNVEDICKKLQ